MAHRKRKTEQDVPKVHAPPQKYPELGNDHTPQPIEQYWSSLRFESRNESSKSVIVGFDNTYEQLKFCQVKKISREEDELKALEHSDKMLMKLLQDNEYPYHFDNLKEEIEDINKLYEVKKYNDDVVDKNKDDERKLKRLEKCLIWSHIPKELHLDYSSRGSKSKTRKFKPKIASKNSAAIDKNINDIFDKKEDNNEQVNAEEDNIFSDSESEDSQANADGNFDEESEDELDGFAFNTGDDYGEDDRIDGY